MAALSSPGSTGAGVGGATGDTSLYAVKAQVFTADGATVGGEFLVNTATEGHQYPAQITALSDGGFAMTWQDFSQGVGGATGDTSSTAVKAQVFAPEGLIGDNGDNTFIANAAHEAFSGLGGSDTVSHVLASAGLTASLANPSTNTGYAAGDTYSSIENLRGSAFNDKLTGDAKDNVLEGGAGKDALDGGGGSDTASYAHATAGVTADLSKPANNTGDAAGDTYKGIENLLGSTFDDKLTGDGAANTLTGGAGIDTLSGGGGSDKLIGGLGADILNGGGGKDQFVQLSPLEGIDKIQDFNVKDDTLVFSAAGFGGGLHAGQHLVAGQTFIASTNPVATTTAGTFLYDTDDHNLYWDPDGSTIGGVAQVQVDHFDTAVALKADDFSILA